MKRVTADMYRKLVFGRGATIWAAIFFLILGISLGGFIETMMDSTQKSALIEYIGKYLNINNINSTSTGEIFISSLTNNLKLIAVIMASGISILGFPLAFAVLTYKGISIGFAAALIIEDMSGKGILLTLAAMIPQNIILIPAMMVAVALSVNLAFLILKRDKSIKNKSYFQYLMAYMSLFIVIILATVIGCFVESYICPFLMKVII